MADAGLRDGGVALEVRLEVADERRERAALGRLLEADDDEVRAYA